MIKNKIIVSILLILSSYCSSVAQNDVTNEFMRHVIASDFKGILELCSDFVEIETDEHEETTSKSQVGFILKEFFVNHPPRSFDYNHIGTSPGGAKYAIASYFSEKGKEFLVVVKFKVHGGKLLIDTIKFSPE